MKETARFKTTIIKVEAKPDTDNKVDVDFQERSFGSLGEFFEKYIGMPVPPVDGPTKIIRPFLVLETKYFHMAGFIVDFGKAVGTYWRHFEARGSVTVVEVDSEKERDKLYAFVQQNRFLFGSLTEAVRGFDPLQKELSEELDLREEPKTSHLGTMRINTGISMTKSKDGDVPISHVKVKAKPGLGLGELSEKLENIHLLNLEQIRSKYLSGEITDPFFAYGMLLLLMKEKPEIFTHSFKIKV